jgi:hypothetical protein
MSPAGDAPAWDPATGLPTNTANCACCCCGADLSLSAVVPKPPLWHAKGHGNGHGAQGTGGPAGAAPTTSCGARLNADATGLGTRLQTAVQRPPAGMAACPEHWQSLGLPPDHCLLLQK